MSLAAENSQHGRWNISSRPDPGYSGDDLYLPRPRQTNLIPVKHVTEVDPGPGPRPWYPQVLALTSSSLYWRSRGSSLIFEFDQAIVIYRPQKAFG